MKRPVLALLTAAAVLSGAFVSACGAADEPAPAAKSEPAASPPAGETPAAAPVGGGAVGTMTTIDRVNATEKGKLKNPFTGDPKAIEEGHKIYMGASCNGCHGGGGGGGMCPPLTNETWVYGGDDDTLFRLITLGSDELKKKYSLSRKGQETVVGPMPPFGAIITDEVKLWKAIAWLRSVWGGRPEKKVW